MRLKLEGELKDVIRELPNPFSNVNVNYIGIDSKYIPALTSNTKWIDVLTFYAGGGETEGNVIDTDKSATKYRFIDMLKIVLEGHDTVIWDMDSSVGIGKKELYDGIMLLYQYDEFDNELSITNTSGKTLIFYTYYSSEEFFALCVYAY